MCSTYSAFILSLSVVNAVQMGTLTPACFSLDIQGGIYENDTLLASWSVDGGHPVLQMVNDTVVRCRSCSEVADHNITDTSFEISFLTDERIALTKLRESTNSTTVQFAYHCKLCSTASCISSHLTDLGITYYPPFGVPGMNTSILSSENTIEHVRMPGYDTLIYNASYLDRRWRPVSTIMSSLGRPNATVVKMCRSPQESKTMMCIACSNSSARLTVLLHSGGRISAFSSTEAVTENDGFCVEAIVNVSRSVARCVVYSQLGWATVLYYTRHRSCEYKTVDKIIELTSRRTYKRLQNELSYRRTHRLRTGYVWTTKNSDTVSPTALDDTNIWDGEPINNIGRSSPVAILEPLVWATLLVPCVLGAVLLYRWRIGRRRSRYRL